MGALGLAPYWMYGSISSRLKSFGRRVALASFTE
jgi:hypothetical protein